MARRLTSGRGKPEMTEPGVRLRQWRLIGIPVSSFMIGIAWLTNSLHDNTVRWLMITTAVVFLVWGVSSDVGAWGRSRRQRDSARPQA